MNAFRCLRLAARPASSATTFLRPSLTRTIAPQRLSQPSQSRFLSLLSPHRPQLTQMHRASLPAPGTPTSLLSSTSETLDLMGKISAHPGLGSMQIRCGPRDTYNPSHLVRKRRHGFLSRIRTKKGRKLLMRRLKKGRWNLSH
ncbi:ribosomal protein L34-domain-containing protein [Paraphoma chrysanthemicola]|uniref:Large ribosomal subunit protein bL34m n=1 Tax=Paraphoma chrysanthemicola TaxID=798071 RepID=A0A8K0QZJ7_9PLEO|nr:ribosomal protein L34-domain-containing protein [Paraphoma chrysanthemicola]